MLLRRIRTFSPIYNAIITPHATVSSPATACLGPSKLATATVLTSATRAASTYGQGGRRPPHYSPNRSMEVGWAPVAGDADISAVERELGVVPDPSLKKGKNSPKHETSSPTAGTPPAPFAGRKAAASRPVGFLSGTGVNNVTAMLLRPERGAKPVLRFVVDVRRESIRTPKAAIGELSAADVRALGGRRAFGNSRTLSVAKTACQLGLSNLRFSLMLSRKARSNADATIAELAAAATHYQQLAESPHLPPRHPAAPQTTNRLATATKNTDVVTPAGPVSLSPQTVEERRRIRSTASAGTKALRDRLKAIKAEIRLSDDVATRKLLHQERVRVRGEIAAAMDIEASLRAPPTATPAAAPTPTPTNKEGNGKRSSKRGVAAPTPQQSQLWTKQALRRQQGSSEEEDAEGTLGEQLAAMRKQREEAAAASAGPADEDLPLPPPLAAPVLHPERQTDEYGRPVPISPTPWRKRRRRVNGKWRFESLDAPITTLPLPLSGYVCRYNARKGELYVDCDGGLLGAFANPQLPEPVKAHAAVMSRHGSYHLAASHGAKVLTILPDAAPLEEVYAAGRPPKANPSLHFNLTARKSAAINVAAFASFFGLPKDDPLITDLFASPDTVGEGAVSVAPPHRRTHADDALRAEKKRLRDSRPPKGSMQLQTLSWSSPKPKQD